MEGNSTLDNVSPTELVQTTFGSYGSIFLISFILFICLRLRFPLTYTYNSHMPGHSTLLSEGKFGHISWIWKIFSYSDDDMFEHCGMAAIVFLRFLRLGWKLSLVGIFNSIFLIPVNVFSCFTEDKNVDLCAENKNDDIVYKISISHVMNGYDKSLIATTIAAYIIFLSAMYFIFGEFKWYTKYRHLYSTKRLAHNYTLYIYNIPGEYQSDAALLEYFQSIYSQADVLEAKVARDTKSLDKLVASREKIIQKLEHALNKKDFNGTEPTHLTRSGAVLSIPAFSKELIKLNDDISHAITEVEEMKSTEASQFNARITEMAVIEEDVGTKGATLISGPFSQSETSEAEDAPIKQENKKKTPYYGTLVAGAGAAVGAMGNVVGKSAGAAVGAMGNVVGKSAGVAVGAMGNVGNVVGNTIGLIHSDANKSRALDAAFVTFSNLLTKTQANQIIHHATPFTFNVKAAPPPQDIVWDNVGISHKEHQAGFLVAQMMTAATCLFWTIPVTFVVSLSEVKNLSKAIPALEKVLEENEWIGNLLQQLSPLLLVLLSGLLPTILTFYCRKESHIGSAELNASLLRKLAIFMIIQIFFVQAVSGSIFEELKAMIDKPSKIIDLLATSVPKQVKSFIQYVLVKVFLSCSLEILRVTRVAMSIVRKYVGPNLSEKERNSTFMGIQPISEPEELEYHTILADMTLFFMINLIYSSISPVMSYFTLLCFGIMNVVYRHQLIYVYSKENDDGGSLWSSMILLLTSCIFIAELTLFGILALKRGIIASTTLLPLIFLTVLFALYIHQEHFRVTKFVPSTLCREEDRKSRYEGIKDQYLQPSLAKKLDYPENSSESDIACYAVNDDDENDV